MCVKVVIFEFFSLTGLEIDQVVHLREHCDDVNHSHEAPDQMSQVVFRLVLIQMCGVTNSLSDQEKTHFREDRLIVPLHGIESSTHDEPLPHPHSGVIPLNSTELVVDS